MKSLIFQSLTIFLILCALFQPISADVVCSEDELIRELKEDIADNGFISIKML